MQKINQLGGTYYVARPLTCIVAPTRKGVGKGKGSGLILTLLFTPSISLTLTQLVDTEDFSLFVLGKIGGRKERGVIERSIEGSLCCGFSYVVDLQ